MINLLPDDVKREIRAARMNVVLLQYNFFTLIAMLVLVGLCLMFFVYLNVSQSSAIVTNQENQQKAQSLESVRKAADDYKANLAIANKIFARSINYTELVFAISKLLPDGVLLNQISVKKTDFGNPMQFAAYAKTFDQATKLKENFQNSDLFSDVFLQNLTDASNAQNSESLDYPVSFTISAQINKVVGQW